jgi:hypothetical protein
MSQGNTTTDHRKIRHWAETRGGRPARVKDTGRGGDPGILRLDFGDTDEGLEEISWDEFFKKFEESELALLYDEDKNSRFNKLIHRKQS